MSLIKDGGREKTSSRVIPLNKTLQGATLKVVKQTMRMHIKKKINRDPIFQKKGYRSFNLIYFANHMDLNS